MWDMIFKAAVDQIAKYFDTFAIFCGFVVVVSGLIIGQVLTRFWKEPSTAWKWGSSWLVSIGLSLLGFFLNLGIFDPLTLLQSIIVGVLVGLSANGIYSVPWVQDLLAKMGIKLTLEKKEEFKKSLELKKTNGK